MASVIFKEFGFPVKLVDPPMVVVFGELVPDINMHVLEDVVFRMLIRKHTHLTGDELMFVRKRFFMRRPTMARVLHVSPDDLEVWEGKHNRRAGMDFNTERVLRAWMAMKVGDMNQVGPLLDGTPKALTESPSKMLVIKDFSVGHAAVAAN